MVLAILSTFSITSLAAFQATEQGVLYFSKQRLIPGVVITEWATVVLGSFDVGLQDYDNIPQWIEPMTQDML